MNEVNEARQLWIDKLTERQQKLIGWAETNEASNDSELNELIASLAKELDAIHEAYANDV